jgi:signal transduction histidine kinase
LSNLLSNAIKYSPSGSTVHFSLAADADMAQITVRDEGIGIPIQDQNSLFGTFFRASNVGMISGSGLGLAIVKKATDLHRGSITFTSEANRGTSFNVTIPARYESQTNDPYSNELRK